MHSAFNLLVFPNAMFTPLLFLFIERAMCSRGEIALKNNHYYYQCWNVIYLGWVSGMPIKK